MTDKLAGLRCTQCGSTDFSPPDNRDMLRCKHCESMYRLKNAKGPRVVIKKGANVKFGKNAKVRINGQLVVEDGANVDIQGQIEIIERASQERIAAAKEELERVKNK